MAVFFILRSTLQARQDVFETGIVGAIHGNSPEGFDEGRKQGSGFGSLLHVQSFHRATAQIFRQLIRPEGLEYRRQLVESGGDTASCRRVSMFDAPRIVQHDVARFAARSVGAGINELSERLAKSSNREAPNIRAAQNS